MANNVYEFKIKIYKKEGYDWATKSIMYSIGSDSETVFFSKGVTYNLIDGKIVKSKLSKISNLLLTKAFLTVIGLDKSTFLTYYITGYYIFTFLVIFKVFIPTTFPAEGNWVI